MVMVELKRRTFHVLMLVSVLLGLAEADAVDDGGVVELVREDGVLGAEDLLEEAGVGVEAAGVQDGVLAAVELGNLALEVLRVKESDDARDLPEKSFVRTVWISCVPQMKRTELRPDPWLRSAAMAASTTSGWL